MPDPLTPNIDHDAFLDHLALLSKKHLLFFRLEVGRLVLQTFYGGDLAAFHSQDPQKPDAFGRFVAERAEALVDLGLSEQVLRHAVRAWELAHELPKEVVDKLRFTHVVELSRIDDAAQRRLLAFATADNAWSVAALKKAVSAAKRDQWIDADPAPGLQPPEPTPAPAEKPLPPGRVVTRVEKAADEFVSLFAHWEAIEVTTLTAAQRKRADEAFAEVEARAAAMRARLRG